MGWDLEEDFQCVLESDDKGVAMVTGREKEKERWSSTTLLG